MRGVVESNADRSEYGGGDKLEERIVFHAAEEWLLQQVTVAGRAGCRRPGNIAG
jgi:hypothetical protein